MTSLLEGDELEKRARELGIDISGDLRTQSSSGRAPRAPDFELQHRIIEAERRNRESRLWILALISAIASVASALTAFWAVVEK
jgi:post-segregation antitoxin (ccd killing protein)